MDFSSRWERGWRRFTSALGPVQTFQWAFITALAAVAWTEALLYFKHKRMVESLSKFSGGADNTITVHLKHNGVVGALDLVKPILEDAFGPSINIAEKINPVPNDTQALEAAESYASLTSDSSSSRDVHIGIGLVQTVTIHGLKQVHVAVEVNGHGIDESNVKGLAISIAVPESSFTKDDTISAVRRAVDQVTKIEGDRSL